MYTYPKWPRMQNICKTHMTHIHLRWWNVCDAYVKRMCSARENICEPYVKHWIALCLCFTYVYVCEFMYFFYGGGKIRPYFLQIT